MTSNRFDRWNQFWAARSPRERTLLRVWGIALGVAALFWIGIAPALDGIAAIEHAHPALRHRVASLRGLVAEAQQLQQTTPIAAPEGAQLIDAIEQSARTAGLAADAPTVLANGDIHLSFAAVSFGDWTTWLAQTEHRFGVRARRVHAQVSGTLHSGGPGVSVDLVLVPAARSG